MKEQEVSSLAAYMPMDRRQALSRQATLPDRSYGAALFADIAGFTPLTQMLVSELGRKVGAEELLRRVNPIYDALIAELHRYGGSVIAFAGDSITCWLDDDVMGMEGVAGEPAHAALRAVACGLAMQRTLDAFAEVTTPGGTAVTLGVKIAIAWGPARRFLVGDPHLRVIETLAGTTLERMANAERMAQTGEVIVSEEVVKAQPEAMTVRHWRTDQHTQRRFALIDQLQQPVPPTPWPPLPPGSLTQEQVRPWLLPAVYDQLQGGDRQVGDLRPVTPLFLRFGGIDYDQDDGAGQKLNAYIRWAQQVVTRYEGYIIQLTIGDKGAYLYMTFGAPVAHEDDPSRALSAALALQEPPEELAFIGPVQIGLSRGEVWTGNCGAQARHCYGVMGHDVNLSARLMMQADPGHVLASGAMSKELAFKYAYEGELAYKGFNRLVSTYRVLGQKGQEDKVYTGALIGREPELEQLLGAVESIFASGGQQPQAGLALIYGEPGIGKSHLVYEVRQRLRDAVSERLADDFLWLAGQSDQILKRPFNPFVYFLRRYFHQSSEASTVENKERFEQRLQQLLAELARRADSLPASLDVPELQSEIERTESILGALLELYWPDSLYQQLNAEGRYQNTMIAVSSLLLAESCLRPVVLEIEDGHWLDAASHELLTSLTHQMAEHALFIMLTSRYADDGRLPEFKIAEEIPQLTLELGTLTPPALQQLAEDTLAGPVSPALNELLLNKTQANPFFAQQILYYLQENGLLQQELGAESGPATWTLKSAEFELPPTLTTVLVARLDRLAESVRGVVQAAAVLGREFDIRLLANLLRNDLLREVEQAEQEQIWSSLNESRYLFKHALLRDAAYEMQLRGRLRELHQLAAETYEQFYADELGSHYGQIAYHYETAYQLGQIDLRAQAWEYLVLAGRRAADKFENNSAADYFSRALNLTPRDDWVTRYDLLRARERIYDMQGERDSQAADLASLVELAAIGQDEQTQADVAIRQGWHANATGNYNFAVRISQKAVNWATAVGDQELVAQAQVNAGWALMQQSQYQAARGHYQSALDVAQEVAAPLQAARALGGLGHIAHLTGDYGAAVTYHQQALQTRQQIGDRRGQGDSFNNLGIATWRLGHHEQAIDYFTQSLIIRQETGDQRGQGESLSNLGMASLDRGFIEQAHNYYERSLAIRREIGDRRGQSDAFNGLGHLAQKQGYYEQARRYHEQALAIRREIGDRRGQSDSLLGLGLNAREQENNVQGEHYYRQALRIAQEIGYAHGQARALNGLGVIAHNRQAYVSAEEYLQQARQLGRDIGDDQLVADVEKQLQELERDSEISS